MEAKITKNNTLKVELAGRHHNFILRQGFECIDGIEISTRYNDYHFTSIKIKSKEGSFEDGIDVFIAELREFKAAIISSKESNEIH